MSTEKKIKDLYAQTIGNENDEAWFTRPLLRTVENLNWSLRFVAIACGALLILCWLLGGAEARAFGGVTGIIGVCLLALLFWFVVSRAVRNLLARLVAEADARAALRAKRRGQRPGG